MIRDCRYQVVIVNAHRSGQDQTLQAASRIGVYLGEPSYDDSFNDPVKRLVDGRGCHSDCIVIGGDSAYKERVL